MYKSRDLWYYFLVSNSQYMKKPHKSKTFDYSPIALRALTRHSYAPPVKKFKDKKHHNAKYGCRSNKNEL